MFTLRKKFKNQLKKMLVILALVLTTSLSMTVSALNVQPVSTVAASIKATPAPTSEGSIVKPNTDVDKKLGINNVAVGDNALLNVIGLIGTLAKVVGVLLGAYGLYKLISSLKDQDSNGITQGIVLFAVGILLFMFETIVTSIFFTV